MLTQTTHLRRSPHDSPSLPIPGNRSTPFLYLAHTDCPITLISLFLLIFSYYGLLEIGLQIERCARALFKYVHTHTHIPPLTNHTNTRTHRPYSYCHGSFNLELESFALQSHDDLLEVARLWSEDDESFVPDYLAFVPLPPKDGVSGRGAGAGGGGKGRKKVEEKKEMGPRV